MRQLSYLRRETLCTTVVRTGQTHTTLQYLTSYILLLIMYIALYSFSRSILTVPIVLSHAVYRLAHYMALEVAACCSIVGNHKQTDIQHALFSLLIG